MQRRENRPVGDNRKATDLLEYEEQHVSVENTTGNTNDEIDQDPVEKELVELIANIIVDHIWRIAYEKGNTLSKVQ